MKLLKTKPPNNIDSSNSRLLSISPLEIESTKLIILDKLIIFEPIILEKDNNIASTYSQYMHLRLSCMGLT